MTGVSAQRLPYGSDCLATTTLETTRPKSSSSRLVGSTLGDMRALALAAMALAAAWARPVPLPAQSPQSPERIDVSKLGPQVGDRVPELNLPDQAGTTRTLQSILGRRGAMLVFIRSADW